MVAPDPRPTSRAIVVLAAVVHRDGRFLVTRRLADGHLPGLWEFPGGKCEPGESHEVCLAREFREELDVDIEVGPELLTTEHVYPEKTVRLHFRRCGLRSEPQPMLGQEMRWITRDELQTLSFPEADRDLIRMLTS